MRKKFPEQPLGAPLHSLSKLHDVPLVLYHPPPPHFYTPDLSGRIMVWCGRLSVRPSVRLSVCGSVHKACKHDTDWTVPARTVKLGTHTTYDSRTNLIDFQGQGSKVKVTRHTLLLNLVNMIQTELFQLGLSNLVHILLITRGRTLLIFKVMGQRSRSLAIHCC